MKHDLDLADEPTIEPLIIELKLIISFIERFSLHDKMLYKIKTDSRGDHILRMTSDGRKLYHALTEDIPRAYSLFPNHRFNPIIEILKEASDSLINDKYVFYMMNAKESLTALTNALNLIRNRLRSEEHKQSLNKFRKSRIKRKNSIGRKIDLIFQNFARTLVIRIDLSYQSCPGSRGFQESDLIKVKKDWLKMRKDLRSGKLALDYITSIAKLECGLLKGYHFHALIFLDGSRHSHDISLAKMIGSHWRNEVTNGEGRYYNCNLNKYKYPQRGIGQINHGDKSERNVLKEIIGAYLSKTDDIIQLPSEYGRVLFQGQVKEKSTRGRPRDLQH